MQLPVNLAGTDGRIVSTTTLTNDLLLAAPGANLRYRIWAWGIARENGATASQTWCTLYDGTNVYASLGLMTTEASVSTQIPGGLPFPVNIPITARHRDTVAGDNLRAWVFYTTERV